MDAVVVDKVVEEVNKVVEEVNKVVEEVNKELVMGVVVEGVVDKEVTKVVEEVNKKLVLDKEADVEVNREVDKEMAKGWRRSTRSWCWTRRLTWRSTRRLTGKWPTLSEEFEGPYWRKAFCM